MECDEERDRTICGEVSSVSASEEHITMDFVTALPRSPKGNNAVWVVVDRLTKSAHFIPFRVGQSTEFLADKYIREIVRLHGVPVSIVSDRDTRFRSRSGRAFKRVWGPI